MSAPCPNVLLAYPRFNAASFWDNRAASEAGGARMLSPPLGLITVVAMLPQQADTLAVICLCRAPGTPVVVGGPDSTSSPHLYEEADFRVIGEAELVIDDFIAAWESGARSGKFEAEKFKADVTRQPRLLVPFLRTVLDCLVGNPGAIRAVVGVSALYLHVGPFTTRVVAELRRQIAAIDGGTWSRPERVPPRVPVPLQLRRSGAV